MTGIVVQGPDGIYPKVDPSLLKDNAAQVAENCRLDTGDITPLNGHLQVVTNLAKGSPLSIFGIIYQSTLSFLHWTTDVNASYVMGEEDERGTIVFTGDDEPAVTTEEMAIDGNDTIDGVNRFPSAFKKGAGLFPRAEYILGVPKPLLKPVIVLSGSPSGKKETRRYVYTFVDNWGWESAPSPVSDPVIGAEDNVWGMRFIEVPDPGIVTGFNVKYVRNRTPDGYVDIYINSIQHYVKSGHALTLSSFPSPWTALNASWVARGVANKVIRAESYVTAALNDTLRLYVDDTTGFEVGDAPYVYVDETGVSEDGNLVVTDVNNEFNFIEFQSLQNYTVNSAIVALVNIGYVALGKVSIPLTSASASGYVATGTVTRKRPYNLSATFSKVRFYRQSGIDPNFYLILEAKQNKITLEAPLVAGVNGPKDSKRASRANKLVTEGWDMPPGYLKGIVANPFGYMVAWNPRTRRDVMLSQYRAPYAWPATRDLDFRQATQHDVVAIAVVGGSVIVLTKGWTYIGDGAHPSSFSMAHRPHPYPCRSKLSVVSSLRGVVYSSDQGYVLDGPALPEPVLLTDAHYDKWTWDLDVVQESVIGMYYRGSLITFWPTNKGHILHNNGQLTTHTTAATCVFYHPETGKSYFVQGDDVFEWEGDDSTFLTQRWKSKKFRLPRPEMFLAGQIFGDFVQPRTATADMVTFKHYGEGALAHTASITGPAVFRLPSGRRYREHEVEVTCKSRVTYIAVNQNKQGLKGT